MAYWKHEFSDRKEKKEDFAGGAGVRAAGREPERSRVGRGLHPGAQAVSFFRICFFVVLAGSKGR